MSDRDCEHGQLARSCNICDLERELKAVTQQRDKLLEALGLAADMLNMIEQRKCAMSKHLYLSRKDRRAIKKRFKVYVDYTAGTNDPSPLHAAAKEGDELALRWLAVHTARRLNPEINNEHDRITKNIRVYPGHFERYIAQP